MRPIASKHSQRGITLFVGLIMLVLITLTVVSAFTLSTSNLKSVGNMQARDEAIAAANKAIEQVLSSPFTTAPAAEEITVDINNDASTDYIVSIATPTCIRAAVANLPSDCDMNFLELCTSVDYSTIWNIEATVNDAKTGAKTIVQTGTRVLLTQAQKQAVCL